MAHSKQAVKRVKQTIKKTLDNKKKISHLRTSLRRVREAVQRQDTINIKNLFQHAASFLHKSAKRKLIHKKRAARLLSRLSEHIKTL